MTEIGRHGFLVGGRAGAQALSFGWERPKRGAVHCPILMINGVNFSDHITSVRIWSNVEQVQVERSVYLPGLKTWGLWIDLFAGAPVDEIDKCGHNIMTLKERESGNQISGRVVVRRWSSSPTSPDFTARQNLPYWAIDFAGVGDYELLMPVLKELL